jgi:putative transferase (TIGR04331 family)
MSTSKSGQRPKRSTHIYAGYSNWPDRSATDRFISWGWKDDDPKVVPAFLFRNASHRMIRSDRQGGLLLIECCMLHQLLPWDNNFEFNLYLQEQLRFATALPVEIRRKMLVRLHAESTRFKWNERQRWAENFPDVKIDNGNASIRKLVASSRLVVH